MDNVYWIYPTSPDYNSERQNWDIRFNVYPEAIGQALNMKGVKEILKVIHKTKSEFAVRGGRHCFEPWSLSEGIILDLSKIDHITIRDKTVKIGAGATLGNIYQTLLADGYFIPAGTRPTVGIGGQGLNGGIGYATRKYGILTDSILSYRIILADGQLVTASKSSHPDLYWALRGCGAGNFGVVVEYELQIYKASKVTVFTYNYFLSTPTVAIKALQWLTELRNGKKLTCQAVIDKDRVIFTGQLFGRPNQLDRYLKGLPEPDTMEIKYVPYVEAVAYFSSPTAKESVKAKSRFFNQLMNKQTLSHLIKFVQKTPLPTGARLTVGFQQLSGSATGSMPWKRSTYWLNWTLRWINNPDIDLDLNLLEQSYLDTLKDPAATRYSYSGMMDVAAYKWQRAYYGSRSHQKRLLAIKDRYDPCNLFRYPQGLSALISK